MLSPAVSTATAEPRAPEPSGLIPRAHQHAGPSPSMGPPDTTFLPSRSRSRSAEQGSTEGAPSRGAPSVYGPTGTTGYFAKALKNPSSSSIIVKGVEYPAVGTPRMTSSTRS